MYNTMILLNALCCSIYHLLDKREVCEDLDKLFEDLKVFTEEFDMCVDTWGVNDVMLSELDWYNKRVLNEVRNAADINEIFAINL